MKKLNAASICEKKTRAAACAAAVTAVLLTCPALAADYNSVVNPIIGLLNNLLGPLLGLVGAVGTLYCVLLGVKFAKAEEPQEREKAKSHLKNAIIGFVLIFVLIVALKIGMGVMTDWVKESTGVSVGTIPAGTSK